MSRTMERVWERDGLGAAALAPLSWLFRATVAVRNAAYDAGLFPSRALGLPTVSIGNLSVGGTGKTPVAAWTARQFLDRGARPAILLRGYGADEPAVHRLLTPEALVYADADRVAAAARARADGADVLILDDAFQHRRAKRDLDVVLVAAEQGDVHRLLPAGPLREGPSALRRAGLLVVTRKVATPADAANVAARWGRRDGPPLPVAIVHLAPVGLRAGTAAEPDRPLSWLAGRRLLAVSGVGAPAAFEAQLRGAGAEVAGVAFPDHHAFSAPEIAALAARAADVDAVVCTLKDAVKLAGRWPANAPSFWYLSQAVNVERGGSILADRLDRLVAADTP